MADVDDDQEGGPPRPRRAKTRLGQIGDATWWAENSKTMDVLGRRIPKNLDSMVSVAPSHLHNPNDRNTILPDEIMSDHFNAPFSSEKI